MSSGPDLRDRITGGIMGLVVGDALGVPAEFKSREHLRRHPITGMSGYGSHHQSPGTWSDDSSLALATMESFLEGYNTDDMMERFSRWWSSGYMTPHGSVFDIGNTTSAAIQRYNMKLESETWGGASEHDNGNGSLMRILPVSLYFHHGETSALITHSFEVSALTHAHIRSKLCCAYYSLVVSRMLAGLPLSEAMASASRNLESHVPAGEYGHLERILDKTIVDQPESAIRGSGYVVHCLEAALWCVHRHRRFEDAVLAAVNLGEDTDTTAAVTGGLAGIRDGIDAIPGEWQNALARAADLKRLTAAFAGIVCSRSKTQPEIGEQSTSP